ncbi:MAG: alpha-amylase family protein [Acidobacteriota bacterium]
MPKNFQEPGWWDQGVVFVGNWEPLNVRRRLGTDAVTRLELPVNIAERYQREHSEETVLKLKEAGVNMIIAHFYKTGLDADREDIEWTKKLAVLCHKHGLKIGTYIGDTIYAETMLRDMPEAAQWACYTESGDPVRYGAQPFRYRADFSHPGYVEHIKRVIRVAIEEVKTDFIHFDNVLRDAPPKACDTPEINGRFRRFLRTKYTPEQLKDRLGFSDISAVKVPSWSGIPNPAGMAKITDSLVQEWIDFRSHDLADYYGKLADYIRQLNPNVVVELNPHGISGQNSAFLRAVDHARLVRHGSVFWTEEANDAQVDAEGILVSKIRSFKAARSLDTTLFVKCRFVNDPSVDVGPGSHRLRMAEAMAFNRNCLGDVGKPLDAWEIPEDAKQYIRFYRENNRLFSATRSVADVAVLRSFPSMAYNSVEPHRETMLMEQALIQHKVPFHIIFDQHLGELGKYKAVILAGQECLSDRALEQIRDYVRGGGGLVATGHTSLFNEWRRVRSDYGLADVLGIALARDRALPQPQRRSFGQGRVAYVPAVIPAQPIPPFSTWASAGFHKKFWKMPKNSEQILAAIRYAVGAPLSVEFAGAPLTTVMELTEKSDGSERALHWLNYRLGTVVDPIEVTLAIPQGKKILRVELFSPERKASEPVNFTSEVGRIRFRLRALGVYSIAVVRFAS